MLKEPVREEAVSEVIGTILILAITVILFAAVFAFVQHIPPAGETDQITLSSDTYYNPISHHLFENMTVETGSTLLSNQSYIILTVNGKVYSVAVSSLKIVGPSLGGHAYIVPGDTIEWNSSDVGVELTNNTSVHFMIYYRPSGQILWQFESFLASQISISSLYSSPSPIIAGEDFTVVVEVNTYDPNGTVAYLNLTSLYGVSTNVSMKAYSISGETLTLYYVGMAPQQIPAKSYALVFVSADGYNIKSVLPLD